MWKALEEEMLDGSNSRDHNLGVTYGVKNVTSHICSFKETVLQGTCFSIIVFFFLQKTLSWYMI